MDILKYGKAICYSGYRHGQSPKTEVPTVEQIAEDLQILVNDGYSYIRMYDPNLHARRVLEAIRANNLPLKCLIGIDSDPEVNNPHCPFVKQEFTEEELAANIRRNDAEEEKLIELVKEFDEEVIAVSVGNENTPDWGAHMVPVDRLIRHARRFKEALNKPVTFCEGYFEWPLLSDLAAELDFISVHSYPYHYGNDLEEAVAVNKAHYAKIKELYPDKQVLFTEVGWSTDSTSPNYWKITDNGSVEIVPPEGAPRRASVVNQKQYIEELNAWLEEDQIVAFLFEAFDEPWKGPKKESSECNWGLYTVDRQKKW